MGVGGHGATGASALPGGTPAVSSRPVGYCSNVVRSNCGVHYVYAKPFSICCPLTKVVVTAHKCVILAVANFSGFSEEISPVHGSILLPMSVHQGERMLNRIACRAVCLILILDLQHCGVGPKEPTIVSLMSVCTVGWGE